MKRWLIFTVVCGLVFVWPMLLAAQEEAPAEVSPEATPSAGPDDKGLEGAAIGEEGVTVEEIEEAEPEEEEEVDAPTDDARGVETYWGMEGLEEVEKGIFINTRIGYLSYFGDFGEYAEGGLMYGVGFGYDILGEGFMGHMLSVEVDFLSSFHKAEIYDEQTNTAIENAEVYGDFMNTRIPVAITYKYGVTKRFEVTGSAIAGIAILYNWKGKKPWSKGDSSGQEEVEGHSLDYFGGGRLGIEYYTGLRHFSLGLDVEVDYLINVSGIALAASPMLKYTF